LSSEKILITSQKLMGDLIVQTAAYAALRRALPTAYIVVLCDRRYTAALSTNTDISELWGVPFSETKQVSGLKNIWYRTKMFFFWARKIRAFRFTRVLVTDYSDKACIWAFFSGAKIRGGLKDQSLSWLLTEKLPEKEGVRDFIDFYLNLAALIAPIQRQRDTIFAIPKTAPQLSKILPKVKNPYIVIHPGASAEKKRWPAENWARLITAVAAFEKKQQFVLVSGPNESHLCDAIFKSIAPEKIRERTIVLPERPLLETAVVMKHARLVLCLDSASRHLAAGLRSPTLTLMTKWILPTWGLYPQEQGHFVIASDAPRDDYDISVLSVAAVFAAYKNSVRKLKTNGSKVYKR
jgi:ADP-heptose:LPS heptosyltransferase